MSNNDPFRAGYNGEGNPAYRSLSAYENYEYHAGKQQREWDDAARARASESLWKPSSPDPWNPGGGGSSSSGSSKVICTELFRQGLFSIDDHRLCFEDAKTRLTDAHFRGYHAWALFVVGKMRKSPHWTRVFRTLAQARVDQIAARRGELKRANFLGKIVIALGEPACAVLGRFSGPKDYRALYRAIPPTSN